MRAGTELRVARERAGLSAGQIAERTKIQVHKIEALESNNFEQLPAGIYLDGIVRAYAHEVGIDAEPLIVRARQERAAAAEALQVAPPNLDAFPFEGEPKATEPARSIIVPSPVAAPPAQVVDAPAVSRSVNAPVRVKVTEPDLDPDIDFSTPISHAEPPRKHRAQSAVLPLMLLLAAVGIVAYFYQSTGRLDQEANSNVSESLPNESTPDVVTPSPQSERRDTRPTDTPASTNIPSDRNVSTRTATDRGTPDVTTGSADSSPVTDRQAVNPSTAPRNNVPVTGVEPPKGSVSRVRPVEAPTPATAAAAPPESAGTAGTATNVSGAWTLATHIESSSYARYEGLQLGYEIRLEQVGNRVTGAGRKVTENGGAVGSRAETPISVAGTIDGDRLTLTFNERGARRESEGKFVLLMDEGGTLRGRFSSTAARSSGTVEAHRVSR